MRRYESKLAGTKSKANDASAKELARTAQTTAETIPTDDNIHYADVTVVQTYALQNSIPLKEVNGAAFLTKAEGEAKGYTVEATAGKASGDTFTIRSEERRVGKECRARWKASH